MVSIVYPTVDEIQYYNTIAIEMFRRSKSDIAKTISISFIQSAIDKAKHYSRDLYGKAAYLLIELTRIHAFDSGNKRAHF